MKSLFMKKAKKKHPKNFLGCLNLNLAVLTFPGRLQPSIISVADLTSVFEMGTGISLQLYPPGNFYFTDKYFLVQNICGLISRKTLGIKLSVTLINL